jgi:Pentapeptide repeats (9 copies)
VSPARRGGSSRQEPVAPSPPDVPVDLAPTRDVAAVLESGGGVVSDARFADAELAGDELLRRASVRDCVFEGGDWANADATEVTFTRVEIRRVRLTGAVLGGAKLHDVVFVGCRLDLASLRFARLERVRFDDCRMEEADLSGAQMSSTVFSGCDLSRATLGEATFSRSEMRGCTLDRIANAEQLRGIAMPWPDVLRSAGVLADGLGIRVLDEE